MNQYLVMCQDIVSTVAFVVEAVDEREARQYIVDNTTFSPVSGAVLIRQPAGGPLLAMNRMTHPGTSR